jgi:hypothetical protein
VLRTMDDLLGEGVFLPNWAPPTRDRHLKTSLGDVTTLLRFVWTDGLTLDSMKTFCVEVEKDRLVTEGFLGDQQSTP